MQSTRVCSFSDCGRRHYAKGLCSAHYQQKGDLKPISAPTQRVIPISERLDDMTDKSAGPDGCWLWRGTKMSSGHGRIRSGESGGGTMPTHRAAYEIAYGPIPATAEIDHRCRVPACVNPSHLQLASKTTNGENRKGANRNSQSGVRNVSWSQGAWMVMVHAAGEPHYGGRFESLMEAERAAIALRRRLFTNSLADGEPTVLVDRLASDVEPPVSGKVCAIEGCDSPMRAKDLCKRHRARQLAGKPMESPRRSPVTCSASGCVKPSKSGGLCGMHYERQRLAQKKPRE